MVYDVGSWFTTLGFHGLGLGVHGLTFGGHRYTSYGRMVYDPHADGLAVRDSWFMAERHRSRTTMD